MTHEPVVVPFREFERDIAVGSHASAIPRGPRVDMVIGSLTPRIAIYMHICLRLPQEIVYHALERYTVPIETDRISME